jgi:hypothetical protein
MFLTARILLVLCTALCHSAKAQVNLGQVALLRWYSMNTAASFPVIAQPLSMTFDGANIWVADGGNIGKVAKVRASDGALLQVISIPTNAGIGGLAFDGLNVWVTMGYSDTVIKLRASDGAILGTFPVG